MRKTPTKEHLFVDIRAIGEFSVPAKVVERLLEVADSLLPHIADTDFCWAVFGGEDVEEPGALELLVVGNQRTAELRVREHDVSVTLISVGNVESFPLGDIARVAALLKGEDPGKENP